MYRVGQNVIPLVHYITLYERYHFFGPPCMYVVSDLPIGPKERPSRGRLGYNSAKRTDFDEN